jgi:predicted unusual protein kinase regulating ubiquinone biosynthesis (AarF/ABC1/UbiB family)
MASTMNQDEKKEEDTRDAIPEMRGDKSEERARLEKHIEVLAARCARLEAQNILVSVQKLDLFARGTALNLSVAFLVLYWRLLGWAFRIAAVMIEKSLPNIYQYLEWIQIAIGSAPAVIEQSLPNNYHYLEWAQMALHPLSLFAMRLGLFCIPYLRHRLLHGVDYRRLEVFAVAFVVIIRMKLARWRENMFMMDPAEPVANFGEDTNEDAIWDANYEVSARFLYVSILRLRGLWTKSAQYLSSRADFMPASYVRELKKLQDEAAATEWKDVEKMLAKAPGVLEALTDISQQPLASASIGQVHTARLKSTGEKVAFKVQHPHARTLLTDDFWSLAVISRIVTWMEPEYAFFEILMREWAVEARKELDFVTESANLKAAQASIDRLMADKMTLLETNVSETCKDPVPFQVEIPHPIADLCTNDVLVMSFCEGTRIDDLRQIQEWGIPREAVMDSIAQTFAHTMYVTDIFNGDPHAGNLLIRPGTNVSKTEGFTISLLDWGLAKRLPEQKRIAFCQMAYAAATFDFGLLLDAFMTVGLRMKRENVAEDMEGMRFFLRDMVPKEKSRKRIKAKIKTDRVSLEGSLVATYVLAKNA